MHSIPQFYLEFPKKSIFRAMVFPETTRKQGSQVFPP